MAASFFINTSLLLAFFNSNNLRLIKKPPKAHWPKGAFEKNYKFKLSDPLHHTFGDSVASAKAKFKDVFFI